VRTVPRTAADPQNRPRAPRRGADLALAGALAAAAVALYRPVTHLWWLYDDAFQVRFVLHHRLAEYAFVPAVWQQLPNRVFTPLLLASLDLDAALFGLRPAAFYLHQLAALAAAAAGLFLLLRRWLPRGWAALAGLLFLLGVPTAAAVELLMVRHYLEGLVLALGATALYLAALRRHRPALAVASGVLFLLSAAAKEIFVPLPLLLVALGARGENRDGLPDAGERRRRWRYALPHLAALALYAAWRRAMLGAFLGGYGWASEAAELPRLAAELPVKVAAVLAQGRPLAGGLLLALLGGGIAVWLLARRRIAFGLGCAALALLPVLPVSTDFEPRFAFASWLLLAAGAGFAGRWAAAPGGRRRRLAVAAAALALGCAAVVWWGAWRSEMERLAAMSEEGRRFLDLGRGDVLVHPLSPASALLNVNLLERELRDDPSPADWFEDDLYLCGSRAPRGTTFWAPTAAGKPEDVTARIEELRPQACRAAHNHRPLAASLRLRDGVLHWELGPYGEGSYAFVLDGGRYRFPAPRRGGFQLGAGNLTVRVKYTSPEGWVTYSPLLRLSAPDREELTWHRR
jgi:hypothetical protein